LKLATKVTIAASSHCKCHSFLLLVDSYCFCCHWLIAEFLSLLLFLLPPFLPQLLFSCHHQLIAAIFVATSCCFCFCCHWLVVATGWLLLIDTWPIDFALFVAANWLWLPFSTFTTISSQVKWCGSMFSNNNGNLHHCNLQFLTLYPLPQFIGSIILSAVLGDDCWQLLVMLQQCHTVASTATPLLPWCCCHCPSLMPETYFHSFCHCHLMFVIVVTDLSVSCY